MPDNLSASCRERAGLNLQALAICVTGENQMQPLRVLRHWTGPAVLIAGLVGAFALPAARADEQPRMRNIVRKMLKDVSIVALEYTVIVNQDGQEKAVNPAEHTFVVGDQCRIRIKPEDDLYIY